MSKGRNNTLSLDSVRVEHRGVETRVPFTLKLPLPPSTNNLFVNVPDRGRVPSNKYKAWRQAAADSLWQQKRRFVSGPVRITIVVRDEGRSDLDNRSKAPIDFLVLHGFINDDSRQTVRELHMHWGQVEGCEITVEPIKWARAA